MARPTGKRPEEAPVDEDGLLPSFADPDAGRGLLARDRHRRESLKLLQSVQRLDAVGVSSSIARGADVNVQDRNGMTPLHYAAALGARPCIRVLVGLGECDYLLTDNRGRYAFELAIESARDYAVARLLLTKQVRQAAKRRKAAAGRGDQHS